MARTDTPKPSIEWRTLLRSTDGDLSESEMAAMRAWADADPRHRAYLERLRQQWDNPSGSPTDMGEVIGHFDHFVARSRRRMRRRRIAGIAAAACLLCGAALYLLMPRGGGQAGEIATVVPGGPRGVVILSQDESVSVDEVDGGSEITVGGARLVKDGDRVEYVADAAGVGAINTIVVPRGSEFEVDLPDGTSVKLNADSWLRFRTDFPDGVRAVELGGEAFFSVAADQSRPFVVKTDLGTTRVYGTKFNIKRYGGESSIRITLVEGSLGFTPQAGGSAEVMIEPEQRLTYDGREAPLLEPSKPGVDLAWINSQFSFERESLGSIVRELARWYDVGFEFAQAELSQLTFTGRLNRRQDLESFLRLFEQSMNLDFTIGEGGMVTVSSKEGGMEKR